jgi:Ca-activated chloride channel family protein
MRIGLALVSVFTFCLAEAAERPIQHTMMKIDRPMSVEVERVNVLFTVASKRGTLVTHLGRDDFKVFEDDQPQNITNFSTETNLPLNIVLLIDTSGSIRGKVRFEQDAAASFFHSALQRGRDKAAVIGFDHAITLLQDYTDNPAVLDTAVQKIISGGSTSLYDAVVEATHKLAGRDGRRVIIILSDGMDNSSHISSARALEYAQKNDIIVYAVSTNTRETMTADRIQGDANLKCLALETGGRVLFPEKMADLKQSFQKISEELRSQYSLAYNPSNTRRDGTYRQIRIVASHKDYNVRSRPGYFAPDIAKSAE